MPHSDTPDPDVPDDYGPRTRPSVNVSADWHPDERLAVIGLIARALAERPSLSPKQVAEYARLIIDTATQSASSLERRRPFFGGFIKDALPANGATFLKDWDRTRAADAPTPEPGDGAGA